MNSKVNTRCRPHGLFVACKISIGENMWVEMVGGVTDHANHAIVLSGPNVTYEAVEASITVLCPSRDLGG